MVESDVFDDADTYVTFLPTCVLKEADLHARDPVAVNVPVKEIVGV